MSSHRSVEDIMNNIMRIADGNNYTYSIPIKSEVPKEDAISKFSIDNDCIVYEVGHKKNTIKMTMNLEAALQFEKDLQKAISGLRSMLVFGKEK